MLEANIVHNLAIDSVGEIGQWQARVNHEEGGIVGLNIEGTASASYEVDVGVRDGAGGIQWFGPEASYSTVTSVSDGWQQAEQYIRIRVTSAATSGATADVAVSRGDS